MSSPTKSKPHKDSDSEVEVAEVKRRLKAPTDAKNTLFTESLKNRMVASSSDFIDRNKKYVRTITVQKQPQARIDLPECFEYHPYGNQKNNIWEVQKDQLRKIVANDKEHFYTYSKEFLSGSFPLVNEHQVRMQAKLDSEKKWLVKKGFDFLNKRTNWNEHPKKPDLAKLDELRYPYVKQATETKV